MLYLWLIKLFELSDFKYYVTNAITPKMFWDLTLGKYNAISKYRNKFQALWANSTDSFFTFFNSRFIPLKKKIKTNGNNEEFYYFKKCLQTRENEIIQPLNLSVDDRYSWSPFHIDNFKRSSMGKIPLLKVLMKGI